MAMTEEPSLAFFAQVRNLCHRLRCSTSFQLVHVAHKLETCATEHAVAQVSNLCCCTQVRNLCHRPRCSTSFQLVHVAHKLETCATNPTRGRFRLVDAVRLSPTLETHHVEHQISLTDVDFFRDVHDCCSISAEARCHTASGNVGATSFHRCREPIRSTTAFRLNGARTHERFKQNAEYDSGAQAGQHHERNIDSQEHFNPSRLTRWRFSVFHAIAPYDVNSQPFAFGARHDV